MTRGGDRQGGYTFHSYSSFKEGPRVIYCKSKLDYRHKVILAKNVTSFEYSCGAELFPPNEKRKLAKSMVLRPNLACAWQIELPYYGADGIGRNDLCSHCGDPEASVSIDLK